MRRSHAPMPLWMLALPLLTLGACGHKSDDDSGADHDHDDGADGADGGDGGDGADGADGADGGDGGDTTRTLQFSAVVDGTNFACGDTYALGGSDVVFDDLRFYLTEFYAIDGDGSTVQLSIVDESPWQGEGVVLLDFEDGCRGGTAELRTTVEVSGPAGAWSGVGFTMGVPFAVNHSDVAAAPVPMNVSSMFWSWNAGHKFLKVDGASTGLPGGFSIHTGSTMCEMDDGGTVTGCANENRAQFELATAFDPDTSVVVFDLGALLDGVDLDNNTADTAPVCMAAPNDPDCAPLFSNLGLPFGDAPGGPPTVFSVQ